MAGNFWREIWREIFGGKFGRVVGNQNKFTLTFLELKKCRSEKKIDRGGTGKRSKGATRIGMTRVCTDAKLPPQFLEKYRTIVWMQLMDRQKNFIHLTREY